MPVRRHEPIFVPSRASSYATRHDYGIEDTINRADYLSSAVLQDTYDAASRSRGKDHELLRNVNAAIADAPWKLRARAASVPPADNRNVRSTSVPPPQSRSKKVQQVYKVPDPLPTSSLKAHRPMSQAQMSDVMRSVRARSVGSSRRAEFDEEPLYQTSIPSSQLWAHSPRILSKDTARLAKAKSEEKRAGFWRATTIPLQFEKASDYYLPIPDVKERVVSRYSHTGRARFGPDSKPPRPFSQIYSTGPSNRSKAAIIGSRMETESGRRLGRPRSEYAANKLRQQNREEIERRYK